MSKNNILVILIMTAVIVVVGYVTYKSIDARKNAEDRTLGEQLQPEGSLPYTDMDGNQVDLSNFEGEALVINAWASWCPFCADELMTMEELAKEFENKEVTIIAINRAESPKTAKAYIETRLGNPGHIIFLLDESDTFYRSIQGFAMPETVFYRKDGSISAHTRGVMTLDDMRKHINEALTEAK